VNTSDPATLDEGGCDNAIVRNIDRVIAINNSKKRAKQNRQDGKSMLKFLIISVIISALGLIGMVFVSKEFAIIGGIGVFGMIISGVAIYLLDRSFRQEETLQVDLQIQME
jgi:hypothetical protein